MKICYIRPKTTPKKNRDVRLYDMSLISLIWGIQRFCDPQLTFIMILCLLLAIVAGAQQIWIGTKNKNQKETEKWDNILKEWERKKKIENMLEEMKEAHKPTDCQNVNVKNLI